MSELPIKPESQKIRISQIQNRKEVQVLIQFPYCLDLYPRDKQLDGNYNHTYKGWWHKGVRMTGQPHQDLSVSSSTKYIKKAGINPKSKECNELPPKTAIKAKRWSEVRSVLYDRGR